MCVYIYIYIYIYIHIHILAFSLVLIFLLLIEKKYMRRKVKNMTMKAKMCKAF